MRRLLLLALPIACRGVLDLPDEPRVLETEQGRLSATAPNQRHRDGPNARHAPAASSASHTHESAGRARNAKSASTNGAAAPADMDAGMMPAPTADGG